MMIAIYHILVIFPPREGLCVKVHILMEEKDGGIFVCGGGGEGCGGESRVEKKKSCMVVEVI